MMLSLNMLNLLVWIAWAIVLLWLVAAALTLLGLQRQRPLQITSDESLKTKNAPLVSILVPARNEEKRVLAKALRSMLAQDYGNFEIIAVNDRSVDRTGAILYQLAREDARLHVIDGAEPPRGWLGKPFALQQALRAARGAWILATDADMIFEKEALRTAVACALFGRFDVVTLIPRVLCLTFWEHVFMPTFGWFMVMVLPVHLVNDPARPEALGVGGFFMIRHDFLRRIGGYGAVRAEVAEDLRMAEILKGAGARLRLEYAPDLARTRMQTNFREIWEGFTKNLFAGTRFSLWKAILGGTAVLLFAVAPPIFAVGCAASLLFAASLNSLQFFIPLSLVYIIEVAIFALINRRSNVPIIYAFTVPLGHALFLAILVNSALRIATGRGVTWKGRKLYERAGVSPPRGRQTTSNLPIADE
jgi:chlorobactene glucosyltransferase